MGKKRFEVEVPDGQHLGQSKDSGGAYRGLLFDKAGKLVGHADLREVDDRAKKRVRQAGSHDAENAANVRVGHADLHEVSEPDSQPDSDYVTDDDEPSTSWGEALAPWVLIGVVAAAAKGVQHVQNRHEDDQGGRTRKRPKRQSRDEASSSPARLPRTPEAAPAGWYVDARDAAWVRFWDGRAWTGHVIPNPEARPGVGPATTSAAGSTRQVTAAHREHTVSMSSTEWQQRLRAMLLARAFSEEQLRLLSHARIEDASPALLELQRALAALTPHEFSHRINLMLEANPSALTEAEVEFLRIFGGAQNVAGQPTWAAVPGIEYARGAVERATRAPTPPGWYDDGPGRQRWWDGQRWTSDLRLTQYERPGRSGVPTPAGWYDDGSGRMRWWDGQRWR